MNSLERNTIHFINSPRHEIVTEEDTTLTIHPESESVRFADNVIPFEFKENIAMTSTNNLMPKIRNLIQQLKEIKDSVAHEESSKTIQTFIANAEKTQEVIQMNIMDLDQQEQQTNDFE